MYDALQSLRERIIDIFGSSVDVRVVAEAKEVSVKKPLILIVPVREESNVIGLGGNYVSRDVEVELLIFSVRRVRGRGFEEVYECFEKVVDIYETLIANLLVNKVLGNYVIVYVSGISDESRRLYGVCSGRAVIKLKRFDVVM